MNPWTTTTADLNAREREAAMLVEHAACEAFAAARAQHLLVLAGSLNADRLEASCADVVAAARAVEIARARLERALR